MSYWYDFGVALDFVRQRWFYAQGYYAFVRTTRWEKGRIIGLKYSVAVGTQATGLVEMSCEGTGSGKLVRLTVADDDRERSGQFWKALGVKQHNGIPSMAAARHYLSLEHPVKEPIPPEQYNLLVGQKNHKEIKDWTDHGEKASQPRALRTYETKTVPHRAEIADDWMGEVPKPAHRSRADSPRRYQVS